MRIGVDFDGVIVDTTRAKQAFCKDKFGIDIPLTLICGGGAKKLLSPEQYMEMKKFDFSEGTLLGELIKDSREVLARLIEDGHRIVIVTGRDDVGASYARKFLLRNKVPFHHIIFVSELVDEELLKVKGLKKWKKEDVCKKVSLGVLIDDQYKHLEGSSGSGAQLFLFDQSWNRNVVIQRKDIVRAFGWRDIYAKLKEKMKEAA